MIKVFEAMEQSRLTPVRPKQKKLTFFINQSIHERIGEEHGNQL